MNALDIVIIAAVGLAFIFAIRSSVKNAKKGCDGCAASGTCTAVYTGGECPVAKTMVSDVEDALKAKGAGETTQHKSA